MLCCVALIIGLAVFGATGQIYLLPVIVLSALVGDIFLYKKVLRRSSYGRTKTPEYEENSF